MVTFEVVFNVSLISNSFRYCIKILYLTCPLDGTGKSVNLLVLSSLSFSNICLEVV